MSELDRELPPGTYTIETDEEQLPMLSFPFPAYRRVSTRLRLPRRPGSTIIAEIVSVDRAELEAALAQDAMTGQRVPRLHPSTP